MEPPSTLEALLQLASLERLPRTGWLLAGLPVAESVAAHALGTALVALALGPRVEPALAVDRAVALAVVHDAAEALLGDLPRAGAELLPPGAKHLAEARAEELLLGALSGGPAGSTALERARELREGKSREARFVRLCDKLQLGVRLVGYLRAGARGLDGFRAGLEGLACEEFPPCDALRREILGAIEEETRPAP